MKHIIIILAFLTLLIPKPSLAESTDNTIEPLAYCDEFTFCFEVVYLGDRVHSESELDGIISAAVDGEWIIESPTYMYKCRTIIGKPPSYDIYVFSPWGEGFYQIVGYEVNGANYTEINDWRFKKDYIVYNPPDSCSLNFTFYVDDIRHTLERTMLVNNGDYIPKSLVKDSDIALIEDTVYSDKGRFIRRNTEEAIISGKEYIKSITDVYEYYHGATATHTPKAREDGPFSMFGWHWEWEGDDTLWSYSENRPDLGSVNIRMDQDRKCVFAFKLDNLASVSPVAGGEDFSFYPNPATDKVHIEAPLGIASGKLSISDITGSVLYEVPLSGGSVSLSLEAFSSGIYFISFYAQNEVTTKQLIIIK